MHKPRVHGRGPRARTHPPSPPTHPQKTHTQSHTRAPLLKPVSNRPGRRGAYMQPLSSRHSRSLRGCARPPATQAAFPGAPRPPREPPSAWLDRPVPPHRRPCFALASCLLLICRQPKLRPRNHLVPLHPQGLFSFPCTGACANSPAALHRRAHLRTCLCGAPSAACPTVHAPSPCASSAERARFVCVWGTPLRQGLCSLCPHAHTGALPKSLLMSCSHGAHAKRSFPVPVAPRNVTL
ncbi:MAG: hypothetical protein J3K34DRAFT_417547 [Monoraphidium minutum]|nr:MAG: hypothetical protein J3K34DRAFT_417547 [Monoraphidium minutum]